MGMINKYNRNLADDIKKGVYEKQLNILIGSGCSSIAMPLMTDYTEGSKEEQNKDMLKDIIEINKRLLLLRENNAAIDIDEKIIENQNSYTKFMSCIVDILNLSNSRQVPKSVNIFTTNYDLFIENAIDQIHHSHRAVFNDGASGYFERILDSTNYNRVVAYKGLNDNYISEIPSVNLIKSHGSVNWLRKNNYVIVLDSVCESPLVVPPTGYESQETFLNNYFHDMLRVFQLELDKPQTILLIIGFSFQDKHIAKMIKRALQNPELIIYAFVYSGQGDYIKKNLGVVNLPSNFKVITPRMIYSEHYRDNISIQKVEGIEENSKTENSITFTLDNLSEILINPDIEVDFTTSDDYEE